MNIKTPSVTVLMSVYNGEEYLGEAIESILNQTFTDFEFVIVDDASTDNTIDIIRSYRDSRIRLVENDENMGQTRSLNIGLGQARGQYIARLDQDDIALENRLEEQVKFLSINEDIDLVGSFRYYVDPKGKIIRNGRESILFPSTYFKPFVLGRVSIIHPCMMFRKKKIQSLNGFNEDYNLCQDLHLLQTMVEKRLKFENIPEVLTLYRKSHQNEISIRKVNKTILEACFIHSNFLSNQLGRTIKPEQIIWYQPERMKELYDQKDKTIIFYKLKIIIEISDLYFTKYPMPLYEKIKLISSLWVHLLMISLNPKRYIGRVLYNNTKVCSRIIRRSITDNRFPLIFLLLSFYALNIISTFQELLTKFCLKIGRLITVSRV